ncbi:MAG TPA: helix-turn-helix domain-containing protein [Polyangiaceae bacterium]|nr:helix-turn-helix domain-containing protein [Polyangiaceae bacterium]
MKERSAPPWAKAAIRLALAPKIYEAIERIGSLEKAREVCGSGGHRLLGAMCGNYSLHPRVLEKLFAAAGLPEPNIDWHPEAIKSALRLSGSSLTKLAELHGVKLSVVRAALLRSSPEGERIIANQLRTSSKIIWPSRHKDDEPKKEPLRRKSSFYKTYPADIYGGEPCEGTWEDEP